MNQFFANTLDFFLSIESHIPSRIEYIVFKHHGTNSRITTFVTNSRLNSSSIQHLEPFWELATFYRELTTQEPFWSQQIFIENSPNRLPFLKSLCRINFRITIMCLLEWFTNSGSILIS